MQSAGETTLTKLYANRDRLIEGIEEAQARLTELERNYVEARGETTRDENEVKQRDRDLRGADIAVDGAEQKRDEFLRQIDQLRDRLQLMEDRIRGRSSAREMAKFFDDDYWRNYFSQRDIAVIQADAEYRNGWLAILLFLQELLISDLTAYLDDITYRPTSGLNRFSYLTQAAALNNRGPETHLRADAEEDEANGERGRLSKLEKDTSSEEQIAKAEKDRNKARDELRAAERDAAAKAKDAKAKKGTFENEHTALAELRKEMRRLQEDIREKERAEQRRARRTTVAT